jgi:poly-gamma-glutamate synthesis protein (capsule biosynthesis protein)
VVAATTVGVVAWEAAPPDGIDADAVPAPVTRPSTSTSSTSSTSTSSTTTSTTAPPLRSFTLVASGDLLPHTPLHDQARADGGASGVEYDFRPMLAGIGDRVAAADLAICHLETMLSFDNSRLSGYPMFLAPFQLADAIAVTGYDACSVASNHALDRGAPGMASTLAHLERVGLRHAGGARSAEEQATPSIYEVHGIRIGHLSYAYGFNGFELPADAPWTVNRIDVPTILAEAARARAAGAEFVVLSLHWGAEYRHAPTPDQEQLAAQLLASPDVDLILGHHAHVVQPVGRVGDEVVVYGMGNLLSNQRNDTRLGTQEGVLVSLEVRERSPGGGFAVTSVQVSPTYVEVPGFRVVPTSPTLHPESYVRVLGEIGPNAVPA